MHLSDIDGLQRKNDKISIVFYFKNITVITVFKRFIDPSPRPHVILSSLKKSFEKFPHHYHIPFIKSRFTSTKKTKQNLQKIKKLFSFTTRRNAIFLNTVTYKTTR